MRYEARDKKYRKDPVKHLTRARESLAEPPGRESKFLRRFALRVTRCWKLHLSLRNSLSLFRSRDEENSYFVRAELIRLREKRASRRSATRCTFGAQQLQDCMRGGEKEKERQRASA